MAASPLLLRTSVAATLLALTGWCAAAEPVEHADAAAKPELADKSPAKATHKVEKADKTENAEKADKTAKSEKNEKPEKSGKSERASDAQLVPMPPLAKQAPHGPRDPMDMLREKLAAKLGGAKTTEPDPSVLRVTTVASPAEAAEAAREASADRVRRKSARRVASVHAAPATSVALQWGYGDDPAGPMAWAKLKPEYAQCASGARQSPIDVHDGIKVELDPIQFDYKPSAFRVLDTGRSVQVNVAPGSAIEVMGRRYELVHFDFQRPAEERIDGRQFELGIHLVHRDAEGHLAIVALVANPGDAQPIIQSVWNNLPLEKDSEVAARTPLALNELLPASRSYYTYMGSLTTPPCSEGVLWMVMKQPLQVSVDQIAILSRLYPMNARPLQAASGRLIKESL